MSGAALAGSCAVVGVADRLSASAEDMAAVGTRGPQLFRASPRMFLERCDAGMPFHMGNIEYEAEIETYGVSRRREPAPAACIASGLLRRVHHYEYELDPLFREYLASDEAGEIIERRVREEFGFGERALAEAGAREHKSLL